MESLYRLLEDAGMKGGIFRETAIDVARLPHTELPSLLAVTNRIRRRYRGDEVVLCSILNARSGRCGEDCAFCAQSSHYRTEIDVYPLMEPHQIVEAGGRAHAAMATEFSLVTSGRGLHSGREVARLSESIGLLRERFPSMERCVSAGIVSRETLKRFREAGLTRFHHNLETSEDFFSSICTTRPYSENLEVVKAAKGEGLFVCSGGIFGLGEGWEERIDLAFSLRELDVDSIPINFLIPIPGTPLEGLPLLHPIEALLIIALFRLVLPEKDILVCGGRERVLGDFQSLLFYAGANGFIIGDYLTTRGRSYEEDLKLIEDLGLRIRGR